MLNDHAGLKKIFDQFPCGVLLAGLDGEVLLANDKAPALLETDSIDLMGHGIAAAPAWCGLAEAARSMGGQEHGRQSAEYARGRKRFVLTVARNGMLVFGKSCQMVMIEDVTRQKELEELRTGFFSEFLKRIKGPLTSVKTALSVLSSEKFASMEKEAREVALLGYEEVQRMHGILSDMGDLFALDTHAAGTDLYLENVEVGSILTRCRRRALKTQRGLGREITLLLPETDTQARVVADYEKMGLVLNHLLDNALIYSQAPAPVRISAVESGDSMEIRIEDSGIGISPEDMPRVFTRFFRSSDPIVAMAEGGGLGLFLAKGFTDLMGGNLFLESRPGGTTACVSFPLAQAAGMHR